jgi:hypothetical protein
VLRFKYPIEYELNPTEIDKGAQWLTLRLKNKGRVTLKRLDVELHSLDTFPLLLFFFLMEQDTTLGSLSRMKR